MLFTVFFINLSINKNLLTWEFFFNYLENIVMKLNENNNVMQYANSFNFNPHKWMLLTFDCSALWLQESSHLEEAFNVDPIFLRHDHQGKVTDYRVRKCLKLWYYSRCFNQPFYYLLLILNHLSFRY